jgi:hypothetical protein
VPSSAKRQLALLVVIAEIYPEGIVVGFKHHWPYTPDMRVLVNKGLLRLSRVRFTGRRGANKLTLTDRGREIVRLHRPTQAAIDYVVHAVQTGTIR